MIAPKLHSKIRRLADKYWTRKIQERGFAELIDGKEPGHRIADYVDDKTTALLKVKLDTRYEGNENGSIKKRSMGDIWVHSQNVFNPVNIKSGLQDMKGLPNVVSMQKLLDYLFKNWIDAYYLLIIKFDTKARDGITHKAYFFDLLDWIEFITYDAGPGQIMLREQEFYEEYDSGKMPKERSIQEKASILFGLFEQKIEILLSNRQKRLERQRDQFKQFSEEDFSLDQSKMRFVP